MASRHETEFTGTQRFEPIAVLGRGSMGVVYRARDRETGAEVALKTLSQRVPEEILHLKGEFRALADITHRNLVELYELIVDDAACFFTMEYVAGLDMCATVREGVLPNAELSSTQLERLLHLARQLALGLSHVHAAGKLHRDVKPTNIMVDGDGRLVLLDFGLATALRLEGFVDPTASSTAGTLVYMAPEQAWGKPPHPAADWYSMGVVLYEAVSGRLPFEGPVVRMFDAKSRGDFAPLRSVAPSVPAALDELVNDLLHPQPGTRPDAAAILKRLEAGNGRGQRRIVDVDSLGAPTPFVGRQAELAVLDAALGDLDRGQPITILVHGLSGIGKSELVRRFVSAAEARGALVLRGRCHPQESVPYKAVDTLVDEITGYLLTLPPERVAALCPDQAGPLTQLFPVFGRLPAFSSAAVDAALTPIQRRRRGFIALRQLLAALASEHPLIAWIDDLQWSDADSARLLLEVLRPPGGPPMLLLLSFRRPDRDTVPLFQLVTQEGATLPNVREVAVEPLSEYEAAHLAEILCRDAGAPQQAALLQEAQGSPFLISELAYHVASGAHGTIEAAPTLRLSEVLDARLGALRDEARDLLEVVSIAGQPLPRHVALDAAGLSERDRPVALQLERSRFLRSTTLAGESAVEAYHDRIRETVVAQLEPERLKSRHLGVAGALRRTADPDPQQLFVHYLGGGERLEARQFGEEAANRAATALAFNRAGDLYQQLLNLHEDEGERARLMVRRGEMLGNAGRGIAAGEIYDEAAAKLGALGADPGVVLGLKGKAAEQYLRVGRIEQGVAALRTVLKAFGIELPTSQQRILLEALRQRLRVWWRGRRYELKREEDIPALVRQRLQACWGCAMVIAAMDIVAADIVLMRHMQEALDSGHPIEIMRALTHDAATCSQFGIGFMQRRVDALMREARTLVEQTNDVYHHANYASAVAMIQYQRAQWLAAQETCFETVAVMRKHFPWMQFEIATYECMGLSALLSAGRLRTVAEKLPASIADADDRQDLYANIGFRAGILNLVWLAEDRPEFARQTSEEVLSQWPDGEGFHVQHYLGLISRTHIALYEGDGARAWATVEQIWPRILKAGWLRTEGAGTELEFLRGRAALAAALASRAATPELSNEVKKLVKALRHRKIRSAKPLAALLEAGLHELDGRNDEAADAYCHAAALLDSIDLELHASSARHRAGTLRGGDAGRALCQASEDLMRAQNIVKPDRIAAVFVPGAIV